MTFEIPKIGKSVFLYTAILFMAFVNTALGSETSLFCSTVFSSEKFDISIVESAKFKDGEKYHAQMKRLSQSIHTKMGDRINVETVLYPMAGFDGGIPFVVFPNAKRVIAIDDHEFVYPNDFRFANKKRLDVWSYARGSAWAHTLDEVHGENGMGVAVLQTLSRVIPDFRLRSFVVFKGRGRNAHRVDGLIEFDQGPNTEVRQYLHLNTQLEKLGDPKENWHPELFSETEIDAIFIKGSNNALDARKESQSEEVVLARNYLKQIIQNSTNPLLLVEGQTIVKKAYLPEFSGRDEQFPAATQEWRIDGTKERIEYSYGRSIYLKLFGSREE